MNKQSLGVVWGIAALFVAACGGAGQAQRASATPKWVEQMATVYYESRFAGDVRLARFGNTDAMVPLLNGLRAVLSDARNEKLGMPGRIALLTGYRPVWKGDALVQSEWDLRVARMKQLPDAEIEPWQKALTSAEGSDVPDVWAMFFMSDIPELFPSEKFDAAKSGALRARIGQLPADAVKSLASVLKMGGSDAAVLIIQNSDFFGGNGFGKPAFDAALQQIQARIAALKK